MTKKVDRKRRASAIAVPLGLCVMALYVVLGAQTAAPNTSSIRAGRSRCRTNGRSAASPAWPSTRTTTSGCYDRPNDLTNIELEAELNPPIADCCTLPPSMIHFDKAGNVIGSFDAPQGHGMDIDSKGFVYLGQNTVRKYDTRTGKLVGEVPHTPETENGGTFGRPQMPEHVAGPGRPGPGGRLPAAASGRRRRPRPRERRIRPRARPRGRGVPRQVSADDADDRRRHRGNPDRRGGQRDVRRRQLPRRPRHGVRPEHVRVQARLGRVRAQAVGDQHRTRPTTPTSRVARCRRSSSAT